MTFIFVEEFGDIIFIKNKDNQRNPLNDENIHTKKKKKKRHDKPFIFFFFISYFFSFFFFFFFLFGKNGFLNSFEIIWNRKHI